MLSVWIKDQNNQTACALDVDEQEMSWITWYSKHFNHPIFVHCVWRTLTGARPSWYFGTPLNCCYSCRYQHERISPPAIQRQQQHCEWIDCSLPHVASTCDEGSISAYFFVIRLLTVNKCFIIELYLCYTSHTHEEKIATELKKRINWIHEYEFIRLLQSSFKDPPLLWYLAPQTNKSNPLLVISVLRYSCLRWRLIYLKK